MRSAWERWGAARSRQEQMARELETARREEEYLRHRERELADLDVRPGEEAELAQPRQLRVAGVRPRHGHTGERPRVRLP